jgi:hypothetical protein
MCAAWAIWVQARREFWGGTLVELTGNNPTIPATAGESTRLDHPSLRLNEYPDGSETKLSVDREFICEWTN